MQRLARSAAKRAAALAPSLCRSSAPATHGSFRLYSAPAAPSNTIEVFVNGNPINIPKGYTVLQACDDAGIEIPRFCYHPRLSIAGNCRMCLVEVEKSPKPVASCAMPAMPGMKIKTDTPVVRKAREGVMEFLLLNHPLDCPICDQGGECDLQDQSMVYGSDRGRFTEYKRSVEDKNLGPLVKTVMTRCIHCTRCVRFAKEVAGVEDLGVTGRGRDSEIGTYVERVMVSEVSGNVIDLCPVGALTSKPFAFTARSWELKGTESVDVTDAVGANIRVDSRGTEVMRILPRVNEEVNEEWISDKARFSYDGLKRQRLFAPMLRSPITGQLEVASWPEALEMAANALLRVEGPEILAVGGRLADAESLVALKDFVNRMGSSNLRFEGEGEGGNPLLHPADVSADARSGYVLNSGLAGAEEADAVLLVGTDPRSEAPLFNLRLRKAVMARGVKVASVGPGLDLTFPVLDLGNDAATLVALAEARHPFATVLARAQRPMLVVGAGVLQRKDRDTVLAATHTIARLARVVKEGWNGYNLLHLSASRVGALDVGFLPSPKAAIAKISPKVVYLLNADEIPDGLIPSDAFVIYQGHHGDKGASLAHVILPGAAFTEKEATYVNTEGRPQTTRAAVPVVGSSRDDWKIIRALSEVTGIRLPYDNLNEIRQRLAEVAPHLTRLDAVEAPLWINAGTFPRLPPGFLSKEVFSKPVPNFYMTDPISRASVTMAKCTAAKEKQSRMTM